MMKKAILCSTLLLALFGAACSKKEAEQPAAPTVQESTVVEPAHSTESHNAQESVQKAAEETVVAPAKVESTEANTSVVDAEVQKQLDAAKSKAEQAVNEAKGDANALVKEAKDAVEGAGEKIEAEAEKVKADAKEKAEQALKDAMKANK